MVVKVIDNLNIVRYFEATEVEINSYRILVRTLNPIMLESQHRNRNEIEFQFKLEKEITVNGEVIHKRKELIKEG